MWSQRERSGVGGEEEQLFHPDRDGERFGPRGCRFGRQSGAAAGNVTGLTGLGSELITKRLEILKDAVPKLVLVGLLQPVGVREPSERAQVCGSGTEAQLGGDRDSRRRQEFGESLSNRKSETGQRDYDDRSLSPLFRRKKAVRRASRQTSVAGDLLAEGVCR